MRVADDAVVPRILRVRVHRARADLDRFAEPVLRHVDGAEHSQRIVVIRPALECACENLLRLERVAAVGFEARTAQRIGRKHGSFASDAFRRRRILTRVDRRRDRSDGDRGDNEEEALALAHGRLFGLRLVEPGFEFTRGPPTSLPGCGEARKGNVEKNGVSFLSMPSPSALFGDTL